MDLLAIDVYVVVFWDWLQNSQGLGQNKNLQSLVGAGMSVFSFFDLWLQPKGIAQQAIVSLLRY